MSFKSVICFLGYFIPGLSYKLYVESDFKYLGPNNKLQENALTKFDQVDFKNDPDIYLNVSELIRSKGYSCEDYQVQTEDGFILGLQRIPPKGKFPAASPPVVFLQHGLLDSSATWVINFPTQSLGFLLADAGCDVWLGNVRGNTYSRRHIKLKPENAEFWDWSWDEMAEYDLPAMLDYISSATGSKEINYIGHSQGTTVAFAAFSRNASLSLMVKRFFALGPVATVGYVGGLLKYLSYFVRIPELVFKFLGVHELLPSSPLIKWIADRICDRKFSKQICESIIFKGGLDFRNANRSRIPVYTAHDPSGTSVKNVVHFAQMVNSKNFQMYGYSSAKKNMEHYNQTTPPLYNLSDMKVQSYVFYGEKDTLADPKDAEELIKNLPNLALSLKIPEYQHLDFIWGLNAPERVYTKIINLLSSN